MAERLSMDYVKKKFREKGYEIINDSYQNAKTKIKYICSEHFEVEQKMDWSQFKRGQICKYCRDINKLDVDKIKSEFTEEDLNLIIDRYMGFATKIRFTCEKHPDKIQAIYYRNFKKGQRCKYCTRKPIILASRHSLDFVYDKFGERGYTLLEDSYVNAHTKMRYICNKHPDETQKISYNMFKRGSGCKFCRLETLASRFKLNFDFVKEQFTKRGYVLLEKDYKNAHTPLKYICKKHPKTIQVVSYNTIQQKHGCKYCGIEQISGENNHNWKGIKSLNTYLRNNLKCWLEDSINNCNGKCVISDGNYDVIHHTYNFSSIVDEVINTLQLPIKEEIGMYSTEEIKLLKEKCIELHYKHGLGVCLTNDLHLEFHKRYGFKNNTLEQFLEFKKDKQDELNNNTINGIAI